MSGFQRIRDLVSLTRPHNCLIAALSVMVGGFLARGEIGNESLPASLMAFFVCAGAYVLNDIYDLRSDRVNKPEKPLAGGRISTAVAVRATVVLWTLGAGLASLGGREALVFFGGWVVLLWLYSWRLKSRGLAGHLLVSGVASSGFLLGGLSGGTVAAGLFPFVIALPLHLAREVAKSVMDIRGDEAAGTSTLAVRMGGRRSLKLALWLIAGVVGLSVLPFAVRAYGYIYMLPVAVGIYPLLGIGMQRIIRATREDAGIEAASGVVARLLKAAMPVGLVAFFLAGM